MSGYWDATDRFMQAHGGGPPCPRCGKEMFPQDDHGRFTCSCSWGSTFDVVSGESFTSPGIPQVDTSGMTDEEKARVPAIHRLHDTPTAAEAALMRVLLQGPEVIGSKEYWEAEDALDREHNSANKE